MEKDLVVIQNLIYDIRGCKVMLDSDLAKLYGVETKVLNQAVKRNIKRFPSHFMFKLTKEEWQILRSQIVTLNDNIRKYTPYVFTEQGVAMLSSVLKSEKAIQINIQIMDTFVRIRQYALQTSQKNIEIEELRKLLMLYIEKNDSRVNEIIRVLNNLIEKPKETKHIGF